MVTYGWNEQFNNNLGEIQYYLVFILILFINRDKEEKTKNGYLWQPNLTWSPDPEKPMPYSDLVTTIYQESGLKAFALLKKSSYVD